MFSTPAHKQADPAKAPGQHTLADSIVADADLGPDTEQHILVRQHIGLSAQAGVKRMPRSNAARDLTLHKFLALDEDGAHAFIVTGDSDDGAWARVVEWAGHTGNGAITQDGHDILGRIDSDVFERFGPF